MLAKELISDVIPAVKTSDSGAQVLNWMDHFRISHMPLVAGSEFLGLLSDSELYSFDNLNDAIGNHTLSLFSPYVGAHQHLYEVIEMAGRLKLSVIPVLSEEKAYLGVISTQTLVAHFSQLIAADQPGALLVFVMTVHDYSLTEMARIVEENNGRVLSSQVRNLPDSTQIEVTLKTNTTDVTSMVRSFERHDYDLRATFLEDKGLEDLYRSRYEEFMRYLNT